VRADDGVDLGHVVQRVEDGEEALARHGEDAVATLDAELVDEDASAGALGHGRRMQHSSPAFKGRLGWV
jgi:hypothetical protein